MKTIKDTPRILISFLQTEDPVFNCSRTVTIMVELEANIDIKYYILFNII